MWKRLNRTPDREIGNPTLIETTVDQKTLEGLTTLNAGDFSISSRPAFGRKKTQDVLKGLPELPLYVLRAFPPTRTKLTKELISNSQYSFRPSHIRITQCRIEILETVAEYH